MEFLQKHFYNKIYLNRIYMETQRPKNSPDNTEEQNRKAYSAKTQG